MRTGVNKLIRIEETDSTNRWLKAQSEKQSFAEGTVVMAEFQTAGKGQRGNRWESEAGKNITCSLILYPGFLPIRQHFLLSKVVALGVKEAVEQYLRPVEIKWPNDIYYRDGKMAGILIENDFLERQMTRSVVGIGLNVNQELFAGDAPNPVSLKQVLGQSVCLNDLLEEMCRRIMLWYQQLKAGQSEAVSKAYHEALYRRAGFHDYEDKEGLFEAQIQSVADDGFLHLRTKQGDERRYAFKEVSFVRPAG